MQREGYEIGRKLVRKLMQEMGLYTIYPKENLSKRNFKEAIVPYLLRNRLIQFPNEVCLAGGYTPGDTNRPES
jgi:putative transposase